MMSWWDTFSRNFFKNEKCEYVIIQPPNVPIYLIIIGMVGKYVSSGLVETLFEALTTGAVFTWAYLEIVSGESLFRRILGGLVMIYFFASRIIAAL